MSTTTNGTPSRLGSLILTWLLSQRDGGTPHEITKALQALLDERGSEADRRRDVENETLALTQAGWVVVVRKKAVDLTASGQRAALGALGWKALPAKADWRTIKRRLSARALELPFPETEPTRGDVTPADERAAILSRHHRLAVGEKPTLQQLYDAFLWRALGIETGEPFTVTAAIQVLFNRMLGASKPLTLEQAIEQLVTKAAVPRQAAQPVPLPADDSAFAARVLAAARATKTGRFGDDKVFISHVLQQLAVEGAAVGDAAKFKDRLVTAHRRGLLSLSRADLVEAMDPKDVEASEAKYLRATFHFVRV